jgi:hypothetical protein
MDDDLDSMSGSGSASDQMVRLWRLASNGPASLHTHPVDDHRY